MPRSHYEADPATSPISIHPYPKQQGLSPRPSDRPSADQEARLRPPPEADARYADFFDDEGDGEGASRSA